MGRLISLIINNSISFFLILFSYVVPKKKGLIIFTSADGINYKDNPRYLYQYLIGNKMDFSPYWSTKSRELYREFKRQNLPVTYIYSLKHFYKALRAEIIVCDDTDNPIIYDTLLFFIGRFKILLTWHGTGFKNIGLMDDKYKRENYSFSKFLFFFRKRMYREYFFIIATSEKDKERKALCFRNNNIFVTGSPRNDIFFDHVNNTKFKNKFNLKQYNKIIMYGPTFRENNHFIPFTNGFYKEFQTYLERTNSVFVIKKHKYDKALIVPDGFKNIIDLTPMVSDVQELLATADILISDYSGIVSDFVLTGRPMLFYIYDYDEYTKDCRSFTFDLKETLPGPFLYNEGALLDRLKNTAWFNDPDYQKKYICFRDLFQKYTDGNSSARVFDLLRK